MASPPQLTQITFAGGIDESVEGEILDPNASFKRLENIRQDRVGGASKRLGFAALSPLRADGTLRTSGRRMFARNGSPVVIDGAATLDEYSETLGRFVNYGLIPECVATRMIVSTRVAVTLSGSNDFINDVAFCNGYYAIAQQSNLVGVISIVDVNGVTVRAPEQVIGVNNVITQLGAYSTYLVAVGVSTGSANITAFYLDTSSATTVANGWVSIGTLATDHHSGGGLGNPDAYFDTHALSDRIAIVYRNTSAGTSRLTVRTFSIAGALDVTTINTSSITPDNTGIYAAPTGPLWVAWNEGTSVKVIGLTRTALATPLATAAVVITMDSFMSNVHIVWFDDLASGRVLAHEDDRTQMRNFVITAGAVATSGAQFRVPVAKPFGKAFTYNDRIYAVSEAYDITATISQSLGVFCDWTPNQTWVRPIAITDPYLTIAGTGILKPHTVAISATKFTALVGLVRNGESQAVALVTYDFAPDVKRSVASQSGAQYFGDSINATFDGVRTVEAGFVQRPPTMQTSVSGTGITGTFSYVLTYENVDADGRLVQSSVSNPVTQIAANQTVAVKFRPCGITNRNTTSAGPDVRQVLWRTDSTGLAPYKRLTTFNNITSSAFTTFNDNIADISANPLLMGTGSLPGTGAQLDRRVAPGLQNLTSYNGFLVGSRGTDLFWSSQDIAGEEPWFSPIFTATVPEDVVALVPLDGTLYILCRRSVYATSGDPPTDNGTQGGLGTPRRLSSDAGCIDSGSVVGCGLGIFFQSDRGIEILGRDGSVQWIGQPVQKTTDAYPYITSATLDTQNAVVRFTLATTRTNGVVTAAGGASLVYDLTLSKWVSKDLLLGQVASEAAQDACMVQVAGVWRYAWLGQDGRVYMEKLATDSDGYLDASTFVARTAESADFKIGGLQGKQIFNRALLLERLSTAHDLSVEVAYDYSTTYEAPVVYSAATLAALLANGWPVTQIQVSGSNNSDGQAVRFRITDATPSSGVVGSGKAGTWLGLTVDITPKEGAMKLPDAAT